METTRRVTVDAKGTCAQGGSRDSTVVHGAAVAQAVKAGKIGPKDEAFQDFAKRTIIGDPAAGELLLAALPSAPIGQPTIAAKAGEGSEELKGHAKVVAAFQTENS